MKPLDGSLEPTLAPDLGPTREPTQVRDAALGHTVDGGDLEGDARALSSPPGYQLGELLGRGGMGEVVLARDAKIGRDVAIKRMRGAAPSADSIDRFTREAKIQARLDHPAIVPVHELGQDSEGRPYFTMKRLSGTTMQQVLVATDSLPDSTMIGGDPRQRLLRAFVDVCLAIDFAHARGVIHRDLKPANIMLGHYGEVYVLDWGVARVLGDRDRPTSGIADLPVDDDAATPTQTGALLGTPGYMAPEQMHGDAVVGPPADVYALGAILFEILVREPLHPRGLEALASTQRTPTASPAMRGPDEGIAPELDAVCVAALAAEPGSRPSAREVAHRVQRYLDGDRDMEQRRALADQELAIAHAAVASGDPARRAEAMRAASRALALDPESREAATIVTTLILEPPRELPATLLDQLASTEQHINSRHARYAAYALLSYFLFVPVLAWVGVTDWSVVGAACVVVAVMTVAALWMAQRHTVYLGLAVVGNIILLTLLSRLFGPFVVVPGLAGGIAVMLQTAPNLADRPWTVIGGMIVAVLAPLGLEAIGVLAPTWELTSAGLITQPTALALTGLPGVVLLVVSNIALVVVMALVSRASALAWRATNRRVEIQTWHLKQLLPGTPGEPPGPTTPAGLC